MRCLHCKLETPSKVVETRKHGGAVLRRRRCEGCTQCFVTRELIDIDQKIWHPSRPKRAKQANDGAALVRAWGDQK